MKYTITDFRKDFSNDTVCLDYIFAKRFPKAEGYYRINDRKCYSHKTTKHQIHPLAGTIFEKSSTPLTVWFEAIYLFSIAKNGVSAKELQRHFGVTYKTAWRIAHQIRRLMSNTGPKLSGLVEADETYMGGYRRGGQGGRGKTPVIGLVQRGGGGRGQGSLR